VAVSGSQWQSVAISGNQWQSMAISGNQWQSEAAHALAHIAHRLVAHHPRSRRTVELCTVRVQKRSAVGRLDAAGAAPDRAGTAFRVAAARLTSTLREAAPSSGQFTPANMEAFTRGCLLRLRLHDPRGWLASRPGREGCAGARGDAQLPVLLPHRVLTSRAVTCRAAERVVARRNSRAPRCAELCWRDRSEMSWRLSAMHAENGAPSVQHEVAAAHR